MSNRIFEVWIGNQASGKTYQLRHRIRALAKRPTIRCVAVLDRLGELGDEGEVFGSMADFHALCRDELPRVAVFQFGVLPAAYAGVFELAEFEGDFCIVIDEARSMAPAGSSWTGSAVLERIALAGRHLRNVAGELRPTHIVCATQYPRSIHISLREQARTIMCGQLTGENALDYVRGEFGAEALARVAGLSQWQWTCVQGRDPR
jgi:hypothetical protein